MTSNIATTETVLPPVALQITDFTRGLIARAGNRTNEGARIKIGRKATINIRRNDDGALSAFLHDGHGSGCTMVQTAEEARDFAAALTAYADALDPQASA